MTSRTDTAHFFRTHRNKYASRVQAYCSESRATQEEMSLRTDTDREELETLCEEHHLLYRELCDRVEKATRRRSFPPSSWAGSRTQPVREDEQKTQREGNMGGISRIHRAVV